MSMQEVHSIEVRLRDGTQYIIDGESRGDVLDSLAELALSEAPLLNIGGLLVVPRENFSSARTMGRLVQEDASDEQPEEESDE